MGRFRARSPGIAVALICICAAVSVFLVPFKMTWKRAKGFQTPTDQLITKYELLPSVLPQGVPIRFVIDEAHANMESIGAGRMFLAQYAASPLMLAPWEELSWAVVDSDDPDVEPEIAKQNGWTQVADLRNGLRVYHTHWVYK